MRRHSNLEMNAIYSGNTARLSVNLRRNHRRQTVLLAESSDTRILRDPLSRRRTTRASSLSLDSRPPARSDNCLVKLTIYAGKNFRASRKAVNFADFRKLSTVILESEHGCKLSVKHSGRPEGIRKPELADFFFRQYRDPTEVPFGSREREKAAQGQTRNQPCSQESVSSVAVSSPPNRPNPVPSSGLGGASGFRTALFW